MKKTQTILQHPNYPGFRKRYLGDIVRYAVEVYGVVPTYQQVELLRAVDTPNCRVSVTSGHGTGKSTSFGIITDYYMKMFPHCNVILTGAMLENLRAVVWKELKDLLLKIREPFAWVNEFFELQTKKFYAHGYKEGWFALCRTATDPARMSGFHREHMLFLCDESVGIADEVLGVIRGTCTGKDNRIVMVSQPLKNSGFFYESHHNLSDMWHTLTFNSEESPLVSRQWIMEKLAEYGGHHNPEYQIKVLGNFSDLLSGFLIPRSWCNEAQHYRIDHGENPFGYICSADVASGGFRDSSVCIVAKVSGYTPEERKIEPVFFRESKGVDPKQFAKEIFQHSFEYPNLSYIVDSVGVGLSTTLDLEELGASVQRLNWGLPVFAQAAQKRFANQRAYACYQMRCGILEGRHKLIPGNERQIDQVSRLPYKLDERGRYVMMPKEQMREKHKLPSPDIADAHAFLYLADFVPVSATEAEAETRNELFMWADEALGMNQKA